ncbi:MAG: glycine zipper domain-containing protein [Thermodesulfobacteriota bacterium]|nr:glycine zipper domain-containing protein [Thermodesulfobacteriota bacterium]
MKHTILLPTILSLTLLLSSCADGPTKGGIGAAGGAAGGALIGQAIGGNTGATLIGAAVGTMVGYMVGNEMDKSDQRQLSQVYEQGVSGQTSAWSNPDSGNQYRVTPQPAYSNPSTHRPCRQAEIQAIIDGKIETTHTTACRDANGQWQLQN